MSGLDVEPTDEADAADPQEADSHTIEVTPTDEVDAEPDERERIDVEPTDEAAGGPEYVLYGGKGGVGKTTMAAATALDSARSGVRTLVVSTDPAHSLSDTFETDVPARPGRIHDDVPLYAAEIDPEAAIEDGMAAFPGAGGTAGGADDSADVSDPYDDRATGAGGDPAEGPMDGQNGGSMGGQGGGPMGGQAGGPMGGQGGGPMGGMMGELGDLLGGDSPMEAMFGGAMPGADEAAAVQLLLEYLDDDRFDRVVVDTAPTGHTLRLLELPELLDSMMGKMLRFRERIGGMIQGVKGMFGGGPDPGEQAGGVEDLEELRDRIERLRTALRDPDQTDFRIVLVPEEMSVLESKRLRTQLESFEIPVGTVVVNRVMEPLADVAADVDDSEFLEPNLEDCAFCQRRWDVQQAALAEAQELFMGTDVRRVPLFADEVRGEEMLGVVAACLR